jgi:hypothetical protein
LAETRREISTAFPAVLFSTFLLVETADDLRKFSVLWFTVEPETLSRVRALCPEFVLA